MRSRKLVNKLLWVFLNTWLFVAFISYMLYKAIYWASLNVTGYSKLPRLMDIVHTFKQGIPIIVWISIGVVLSYVASVITYRVMMYWVDEVIDKEWEGEDED